MTFTNYRVNHDRNIYIVNSPESIKKFELFNKTIARIRVHAIVLEGVDVFRPSLLQIESSSAPTPEGRTFGSKVPLVVKRAECDFCYRDSLQLLLRVAYAIEGRISFFLQF